MNQPVSADNKRSKAYTSAILRALVACYLGFIGIKIAQNQDGSMQTSTARMIGGAFLLAAVGFGIFIVVRLMQDLKNASRSADASAEEITEAQTEAVIDSSAESSAFTEEFRAICAKYFDAAEQAEQNRKPADGLMGFGKKSADAPCHDQFAAEMESAFQTFAQQQPDSNTVRNVLLEFYRLPQVHEAQKSVYWMLNAVQRFTLPLIARLKAQDAAAVYEQYAQDYPKLNRLPVHAEIAKALQKQSE